MGSGRPLFPETDVRFMEVTQMEIEMSQQEVKHRIRVGRDFMKMPDDEELFISDQQKRLKQPPLAKAPVGSERISLAADFSGLHITRVVTVHIWVTQDFCRRVPGFRFRTTRAGVPQMEMRHRSRAAKARGRKRGM